MAWLKLCFHVISNCLCGIWSHLLHQTLYFKTYTVSILMILDGCSFRYYHRGHLQRLISFSLTLWLRYNMPNKAQSICMCGKKKGHQSETYRSRGKTYTSHRTDFSSFLSLPLSTTAQRCSQSAEKCSRGMLRGSAR